MGDVAHLIARLECLVQQLVNFEIISFCRTSVGS